MIFFVFRELAVAYLIHDGTLENRFDFSVDGLEGISASLLSRTLTWQALGTKVPLKAEVTEKKSPKEPSLFHKDGGVGMRLSSAKVENFRRSQMGVSRSLLQDRDD